MYRELLEYSGPISMANDFQFLAAKSLHQGSECIESFLNTVA